MKKSDSCMKDHVKLVLEDKILHSNTFSSNIWKDLEILEAKDSGYLKLRMKIEQKHCNMAKVMHGGMTASLMDILGSWSILLVDVVHFSVSTELNITFMSPGKLNDSIILEAECDKLGRTLGYSSMKIYSEADGKLIATGKLTKLRIMPKI